MSGGGYLMIDGVVVPASQGVAVQPDLTSLIRAEFERRIGIGLPVDGCQGAVQMDLASRQELTSAVVMAGVGAWPEGGFWRMSDNTNLPLTAAQVIALGKAAAGYYQALFATRSALLDAARAGAAVDPLAGWPEPARFDPAH